MSMQDALDVKEMERSSGWQIVKSQVEEEIKHLEDNLTELKTNRSPSEIGGEYIEITEKIKGLRRVLEIVEDIKARQ